MKKDANTIFNEAFYEAKMLTGKILLNLDFQNKARDCIELDRMNDLLESCRKRKTFNVRLAARDTIKITKQVDSILNEFKKVHNL